MANSALLILSGNGTLAGEDRAGPLTAAGTGAVRYAGGKFASSQALLIEEGTTNRLGNGSAENTDVTVGTNTQLATRSRVTTYAAIGSASFEVVTQSTGVGGLILYSVTAMSLTGARTITASASVRGSGQFQIRVRASYNDGTKGDGAYLAFTAGDAFARLVSPALVVDPAKTITGMEMEVYTSTGRATTFHVDAAQIEDRAYATSYADGSLGTGYAWSGTAHASSSTRSATTVKVDDTARIDSRRGSIAMWVYREGAASEAFAVSLGDFATSDTLAVSLFGGTDEWQTRWKTGSLGLKSAIIPGAVPMGSWHFVYTDWDGTAFSIAANGGTPVTGTRDAPAGTFGPSDLTIGGLTVGGGFLNGRTGPLMTFDRPLTDEEQSTLYQRTAPWWFAILDDTRQAIPFRGGPKRLARSMWRATVDNVRVEDITAKVTGASVSMDIDRTILSTLSVDLIDPAVVQPYSDYLAPTVTITEIVSGVEVTSQLGLYRAGLPSVTRHPKAVVGTVGGEDIVSLLVNSGTGAAPYNLAPGANYMAAAVTQCNLAGVTRVRFPVDARTVPTGKYHSWPPGTARCRIVLDIMLILGYLPPWSDHEGTLVTRVVEDPGTQAPARSYVDGDGSDLTGEVVSDPATTTLANHLVVTYDNIVAGTVLTAERTNTDPTSPASIPNIGERFRHETMTQAADQAAVDAYASQLVEQWGNVLMHLSLTTPLDPLRGYWESADVAIHADRDDGGIVGRFRIKGWEHSLTDGTTAVSQRRTEPFGKAIAS